MIIKTHDKPDLKTILTKAGWYDGRSIREDIGNTPLYKLLPQKVGDFFSEFGGLKISMDHFEEIDIVGIDFFNSPAVYEYCKKNLYSSAAPIDIINENDEYYYSVLIGKQIYFVATLKEQNYLMMDEDGNFYLHTFIPDFFWIANESWKSFEQLLYGCRDAVILNEQSLKWLPPANQELICQPPVNNNLTKNPWS